MSSLQQIEKRHADRRSFLQDFQAELARQKPVLFLSDTVKEHSKFVKESQDEILERCFLVDHDMQVLLVALRQMASDTKKDLDQYVRDAWARVPMEPSTEKAMRERELAAEEEHRKKTGDVPGQMKLVQNDGSTAEAAGLVTTRKSQ